MKRTLQTALLLPALMFGVMAMTGCAAHKIVTAPVKGAYKTTKFVTKTTAKTAIGTGKVIGKTIGATGKTAYFVGSVPVTLTDRALDSSAKVLSLSIQTVDLAGKSVTLVRDVQAAQLNAELTSLSQIKGITSIMVDAAAS